MGRWKSRGKRQGRRAGVPGQPPVKNMTRAVAAAAGGEVDGLGHTAAAGGQEGGLGHTAAAAAGGQEGGLGHTAAGRRKGG
jgi:hypothetical protein